LIRDILTAIEPFNIAGFGRPERRNWYPVEARDLMEDAGKLGTTQQEVRMMLLRCGFEQERELTRS
jgi:FADH2 O2-dependent halogenase